MDKETADAIGYLLIVVAVLMMFYALSTRRR